MKTRTAWVFPGQGCQEVRLKAALLELPHVKAKLEQSEQILGWSVPDIWSTYESKRARTLYTQPCLYVVLSIFADLVMQQGERPVLLAGYSLGEYVALYTAGVYSFECGLRLVQRRAELMDKAPAGAMVLLVGAEYQRLVECVRSTPGIALANDDPDKVIISGSKAAVEAVVAQVQAKHIFYLSVDKPFHSPLMAGSAEEFSQVLESVSFKPAQIPLLSGLKPSIMVEASAIKQCLLQQIAQPVQWRAVSLQLVKQGVERVVEISPGKFLSSLIKQTCPSLVVENFNNVTRVERVVL